MFLLIYLLVETKWFPSLCLYHLFQYMAMGGGYITMNNGKDVGWRKSCGGIIEVCDERQGKVSLLDDLSL